MLNSKIEVLVIEDDLTEAELIREMLVESGKQRFSVQHVLCLADGLTMLQSRSFDCVLTDLGLPDSQGLETALAVRDEAKRVPVVVLTVLDDEDMAMKSLQMDIQDYLVKGEINTALLIRSIRYAIERKRIIEELRETEQRFASFMLNLPAAAWIKDTQGRYVYANAQAERVFSMPLPEMLGKTDGDVFPPETARQFRENDQRALAEGVTIQTTEVLRQADGIDHYSIVNKFPLAGPDGKPAYVAGVALDITERKRMETELEHFASFPLLNPTPILEMDADGNVAFCNSAAEKMLGKMMRLDSSNPLIPGDLPDILRDLQQQKVSQFHRTVEVGDLIFDEIIYLAPQFNSVRILAMDITERKLAEQKLQESEERLRLAIEVTGLGTFDYFPQTGELIWSDEIKRHFGLPPEARVDYGVFLAGLHPDDRERVGGIIQNLMKRGAGGEYDVEYRTIGLQDGIQRWIAAHGRVFYDATGRAVRYVGAALDISERKRDAEKIEELNTNLALANQALEAFNYTVAHDLRKPLTIVNGYCQAIKELCGEQLDAHCKAYLQEAYDGTLRMNRLIDALLNFSRMAHLELRREKVDLSGMAQVMAAELRLAEPGRRVDFRIADGMSADGDAALLRVVLENLLGNAWKYTATRDEGIIEFGATEVDGKPAWFIRDNGAGFDMADADKLFTPFQRLPGAAEFRGHGIGLATVERIISRHGGKIWAEGEPSKGATFWFTLSAD